MEKGDTAGRTDMTAQDYMCHDWRVVKKKKRKKIHTQGEASSLDGVIRGAVEKKHITHIQNQKEII